MRLRPGGGIRVPIATEATMKPFLFIAVALLVVGGIYHTEVADWVANWNDGTSYSGGGPSIVGSMRDMGNANNNLMNGVSNALDR